MGRVSFRPYNVWCVYGVDDRVTNLHPRLHAVKREMAPLIQVGPSKRRSSGVTIMRPTTRPAAAAATSDAVVRRRRTPA